MKRSSLYEVTGALLLNDKFREAFEKDPAKTVAAAGLHLTEKEWEELKRARDYLDKCTTDLSVIREDLRGYGDADENFDEGY